MTSTSLVTKMRFAGMTATALASMLALGGEEALPSRYYALSPPFVSGYAWEVREDYDRTLGDQAMAIEHYTIMREFIARIAVQSKDLEPHYGELISKHFWELV